MKKLYNKPSITVKNFDITNAIMNGFGAENTVKSPLFKKSF